MAGCKLDLCRSSPLYRVLSSEADVLTSTARELWASSGFIPLLTLERLVTVTFFTSTKRLYLPALALPA